MYVEVQDDLPRMHNMIKRLTSTIFYLTCPFLAILMLTAKPIFIILYSERWLESIPYFQVLCLAGMGVCLSQVNLQPIAAIGKSKLMFTWVIVKRAVGLGAIFLGLIFGGMNGLLLGVIINCWFSYFVNVGLVSKYIGYSWVKQLWDLVPIAIAVLISGCVSYFCGKIFGLNVYWDGAIKLSIFLLLYVGWSHFFKPESYTYTKSIILPMMKKYKKKIKKK